MIVYIQQPREGRYALREALLPFRETLSGLREPFCALHEALLPFRNQLVRVRERSFPFRKPLFDAHGVGFAT